MSAVVLIAVVCAVIGTVTTIALRSHLYQQLDDRLGDVAKRASGPPRAGQEHPMPGGLRNGSTDPLLFITMGPQDLGTVGAVVDDSGSVSRAVVSEEAESGQRAEARNLDAEARATLGDVARDGRPHSADIPGLGAYRVQYTEGTNGTFLVGTPAASAENTVSTLIVVEVCLTGAGLLAASFAGAAIVSVALRPLRRVAATATRVSELPLHTGEVALHERVPEAEADPATEVGQMGAALNRMLDHVHSALSARQESETRVRRFVADASHELRTPLASILGYAELTRRGRETTGPDTRHALGRIESEAGRMTGLVEDLLLLARLDSGQALSYDASRPTDLSPLVVDAVSDARAAGPGHVWRLALPDEPAVVRADPARLHQVLTNLLANARTHTPPGTTVTARVVPRGADLCVEVVDDGPGIPAALLPHVFERFARGDVSRARAATSRGTDAPSKAATSPSDGGSRGQGAGATPSTGSTGLGLAIVRAVVAAHGGTVTVESVPGHTVFRVLLPAVPVAELDAWGAGVA
ncbi:sensor histidine kinase [Streptomyces tsukubensis]|uniref:sensor histidine kinase n=1 Tax=Streptomyces tsukubensis TaxID=83656 RepID=UPI00277B55AE|nr:HAMP domain-containing sensor histidine kinase [Streptomyces tsukubensis]